jgi:transcriptional regulator with GAF, ATPase, and Fis domain
MQRLWHHFRHSEWQCAAEIYEALAQFGICTHPLLANAPPGPGILFLDDINRDICLFLREISRAGFERVLAVVSSNALLRDGNAWRLMQAGASDALAQNHSSNLAPAIATRFKRWEEIDGLVSSPLVRSNLVGQSALWTTLLRRVVEVARFTDAAVLILGESGTGKELVARLIHTLDPRLDKRDLIVLDCTTIAPDLSGSEFFGHERGAFTGAATAREGAFALADGGTLFLDETGELPLGLQAQLLRVTQEHAYKRVGSHTWRRTNFRLVCATNKDLRRGIEEGIFRRDLYHRIASWVFQLPPLRERPEDILPLARHFLGKLRPGEEPLELDEPVREYLLRRDYPGNVRDLKQLVCRIGCRHVGTGPITVGDIPEDQRPVAEDWARDWHDPRFEQAIRHALLLGVGLKEIGTAATALAISVAIEDEQGSLQRAARRLGVTDRALQMRRKAVRGVQEEAGGSPPKRLSSGSTRTPQDWLS